MMALQTKSNAGNQIEFFNLCIPRSTIFEVKSNFNIKEFFTEGKYFQYLVCVFFLGFFSFFLRYFLGCFISFIVILIFLSHDCSSLSTRKDHFKYLTLIDAI